jgi:hypothetical protein
MSEVVVDGSDENYEIQRGNCEIARKTEEMEEIPKRADNDRRS